MEEDPKKENGQATMATYNCDRNTGKWHYQTKEADRDINLDLYIYKLTPEGDIESRCDTEGWRRHPEHCSDSPDLFIGPWDQFPHTIFGVLHVWPEWNNNHGGFTERKFFAKVNRSYDNLSINWTISILE